MFTLIIVAYLSGGGKAIAIHDIKVTTQSQCEQARDIVQQGLSLYGYGGDVKAVCVKTE